MTMVFNKNITIKRVLLKHSTLKLLSYKERKFLVLLMVTALERPDIPSNVKINFYSILLFWKVESVAGFILP